MADEHRDDAPESSQRPGAGDAGSWWRRLVELAAFVALPPALAYVLGLGALWIRLSDEYERLGLYTTWYAASLVPKGAVAGQGIEVLWKALSWTVIVAGVSLLVSNFVALSKRPREERRTWLGFIVVPISVIVVGIALWTVISTVGETSPAVPTFRIFGAMFVFYFLALFGLWNSEWLRRFLSERVSSRFSSTLQTVMAVAAVLCVGLFVLFPGEATLPCLWRVTDQGGEDFRSLDSEGGFLAHSEGHWYVIDEEQLKLTAIPDDEAVRVVDGEFSTGYTRIGADGRPTGLPVKEEAREPNTAYLISGVCG